ncbi:MAG TPA: hypothetical protein VK609_21625 [Mucilaginibacter sp.]|nr:hypothetical protein [Mucilaginibacter sp.]
MKNNKIALKMNFKKSTIVKLNGKPSGQFLNMIMETGTSDDTSTTTSLLTVTHRR